MGVLLARTRRIAVTALVIALFLVLAGATYQGAATALERRQFPHPGRLIDVGGHQLHIHCIGQRAPAIVLEAPATGMSSAWGWVQPEIARHARVCSYDRAGLGWSEAGTRPYLPDAVAHDLHTLLDRAGEKGPYVMVGQGLGAALATIYASRFAPDVAGLLLVDPPGPDGAASAARMVHASPWLARAGVLRATRLMSARAEGLPQASAGPLAAFLNRPDHLTRAASELARWDDTIALASSVTVPATIPVVRVDAGGREQTALLTNAEQAAAVTTALVRLVEQIRATP
jgi:pimeloyl-ACP methyl ester carboxylesterase